MEETLPENREFHIIYYQQINWTYFSLFQNLEQTLVVSTKYATCNAMSHIVSGASSIHSYWVKRNKQWQTSYLFALISGHFPVYSQFVVIQLQHKTTVF